MCDIACAGSAFCNRPMNRHICIVITIDYVVFHFFFYFFPLINDARIKNTVFFSSLRFEAGNIAASRTRWVYCVWVCGLFPSWNGKDKHRYRGELHYMSVCFKNWLCPIFRPSAIHDMRWTEPAIHYGIFHFYWCANESCEAICWLGGCGNCVVCFLCVCVIQSID